LQVSFPSPWPRRSVAVSGMSAEPNRCEATTAIAAGTAIVRTEIVSNSVCVTMLVPVVIAMSGDRFAPGGPGCCRLPRGRACLSFMLPISTPPTAIVYSAGLVPIGSMIRLGVLLDIFGLLTIVLGLRLLAPLLGFAEPDR